MKSAFVVWIGCSLGLFCSGYSRNAGWISFKEQNSRWAAEYTGICYFFHIWCFHTSSGTEHDERKSLSDSGMVGMDCCGCYFYGLMCLDLYKKKEGK